MIRRGFWSSPRFRALEHRGDVFVLGCKWGLFAKFYLERRSGHDKREGMCNERGRAEGEVRALEV